MPIRNVSMIRHLVASGVTVAAVDAIDTVHVWCVDSCKKLCEVPTFPKAPGIRVAFGRGCSTLYAGSWYAGGAMCYSLSESRQLWRRKELVRFSDITADGWDCGLYCCFDGRASVRLDPATGQTVERLAGLKEVYSSPIGDWYLVGRRTLDIVSDPTATRYRIPRTTFAILGVAFAPDRVAVSESGGPVRCFSLKTGKEKWRHVPVSGVHLIDVTFCEALDVFIGVEWAYKSGGASRLVSLTRTSGSHGYIGDLPEASDGTFCSSGNLLVNSEGDVVEVASAKVLHRLDFPREEYEDPEFPTWEERMRTGTPEQRELARLLGPPEL